MRFYYICAKLFSFELKNTKKNNKIDIRSMSPKNAMKIINIQKSYSVYIGSIWSNLIQFSPLCLLKLYSVHSVLFNPHWLYSVHIRPILSISVLFGLFCPLSSYSIDSIYFGSIWPYSVYIGPIWSILSTLIHFSPIRSTSV